MREMFEKLLPEFTKDNIKTITEIASSYASKALNGLQPGNSEEVDKARSQVISLINEFKSSKNIALLMYAAGLISQFGLGDLMAALEDAFADLRNEMANGAISQETWVYLLEADDLIFRLQNYEMELDEALEEYKLKISQFKDLVARGKHPEALEVMASITSDPKYDRLSPQNNKEIVEELNQKLQKLNDQRKELEARGASPKELEQIDSRVNKLSGILGKMTEMSVAQEEIQQIDKLQKQAQKEGMSPKEVTKQIQELLQSNKTRVAEASSAVITDRAIENNSETFKIYERSAIMMDTETSLITKAKEHNPKVQEVLGAHSEFDNIIKGLGGVKPEAAGQGNHEAIPEIQANKPVTQVNKPAQKSELEASDDELMQFMTPKTKFADRELAKSNTPSPIVSGRS